MAIYWPYLQDGTGRPKRGSPKKTQAADKKRNSLETLYAQRVLRKAASILFQIQPLRDVKRWSQNFSRSIMQNPSRRIRVERQERDRAAAAGHAPAYPPGFRYTVGISDTFVSDNLGYVCLG